jgi:hypothetical protein
MNINVNHLFGKTDGVSGMVSDYNSIKNGSYGKLMKSYYKGQAGSTNAAGKSDKSNRNNTLDKIMADRKNPTLSKEATAANAKLNSSLKTLTTALSALQSKDTYKNKAANKNTAADKNENNANNSLAKRSLKDFVSSYNDAVKSSKKSTMNNISKNVANMMKAAKENEDKFKELGVNINRDGTLTVNEDKLNSADDERIAELFDGDKAMSFGSKAASSLNRAASYTVNEDNAATAAKDAAKTATADRSRSLMDSITGLKDEETYAEGNALEEASDFVDYYNSTLNSARNAGSTAVTANLSSMMQKTAQNSGALAEIGVNVGTDGRLSINADTFRNTDTAKLQDTLTNFAGAIESDARLLNYFSTTGTEANAGYSANGGYNITANDLVSGIFDNLQ